MLGKYLRLLFVLLICMSGNIIFGMEAEADPAKVGGPTGRYVNCSEVPIWIEFMDEDNQKILDKLTQKFNLGGSGPYIGYVLPVFYPTARKEDKSILVDGVWLKNASKGQKEFIFGHELGHVVYPKNIVQGIMYPVMAKCCTIQASGLLIGGLVGHKCNDSGVGALAGALMGGFASLFLCRTLSDSIVTAEISSYLQGIEYAADKISVETSGCYQEAIDFFDATKAEELRHQRSLVVASNKDTLISITDDEFLKKHCEVNGTNFKLALTWLKTIKTHPSNLDRIARIKVLQQKNNGVKTTE